MREMMGKSMSASKASTLQNSDSAFCCGGVSESSATNYRRRRCGSSVAEEGSSSRRGRTCRGGIRHFATRALPSATILFLICLLSPPFAGGGGGGGEDGEDGRSMMGVLLALAQETEDPPSTCEVGNSGGLVLPLFGQSEQAWPRGIRIVLYFFGLIWSFVGVGIVADTFMSSIEVITSEEKTIQLENGATAKVAVWNATVANLTLMALGSSAPEILLNVVEIMGNGYFAGALGPSTIVGSAAFNMLIIIAVCVIAIPSPDIRRIKDMNVFGITAFFSVFAYLWLLVILVGVSPNVITITEALLTLAFFPLLVILAWMADTDWFGKRVGVASHVVKVADYELHLDVASMLSKFSSKRKTKLSPDEALRMMRHMKHADKKPSRAQQRIEAVRALTGGKRVISPAATALNNIRKMESQRIVPPTKPLSIFNFSSSTLHCVESDGKTSLRVCREPAVGEAMVAFATEAGTASAGHDYTHVSGSLVFRDGEFEKTIEVPIIDDDEAENDEVFYVVLSSPSPGAELGPRSRCSVTIVDDDEPGELGFKPEDTAVNVIESAGQVVCTVTRVNGNHGLLTCKYVTEPGSAMAGADYEQTEGELVFHPGEMSKDIVVKIVDDSTYEKAEDFKVRLFDFTGPRSEVKTMENIQCLVTIINDDATHNMMDECARLMAVDVDRYRVGTSSWSEQFHNAWSVNGGEDAQVDENGVEIPASGFDKFMHIVSLPWKLLFACIPPTEYANGKVCFVCSLAMIAVVTVYIGDIASLFGCVIGLRDPITAITLVALGTSLPDTFASKGAAMTDDTADAAIGNVTGSNSVNVFLGLGLPWSMAAIYWKSVGATAEWTSRYGGPNGPGTDSQVPNLGLEYPNGVMAVPAGSLSISVAVFSVCATVCLSTLVLRRKLFGGELGGPQGPANATFVMFTGLWVTYVLLSCLKEYGLI